MTTKWTKKLVDLMVNIIWTWRQTIKTKWCCFWTWKTNPWTRWTTNIQNMATQCISWWTTITWTKRQTNSRTWWQTIKTNWCIDGTRRKTNLKTTTRRWIPLKRIQDTFLQNSSKDFLFYGFKKNIKGASNCLFNRYKRKKLKKTAFCSFFDHKTKNFCNWTNFGVVTRIRLRGTQLTNSRTRWPTNSWTRRKTIT